MTISPDQRRDAMARALAYMLERIGDESVVTFDIPSGEGPLADLPVQLGRNSPKQGSFGGIRLTTPPCGMNSRTAGGSPPLGSRGARFR